MTTTSSFLADQELGLEYKPGFFTNYREIAFIRLVLDALVTNEALKTVTLHGCNDVTAFTHEGSENNELRVSRYDWSKNSCLAVRMEGLGRSYFFIIPNEDVMDVDRKISSIQKSGIEIFAVQSKTFLLSSQGNRTPFVHCAETTWPVGMVKFYWTDIPSTDGND